MSKAKEFYKNNIEKAKKEIEIYNSKGAQLGVIRLLIVIVTCISLYVTYKYNNIFLCILSAVLGVALFSFLAVLHGRVIENRRRMEVLLEINDKGLKRVEGNFKDFKDRGQDLINESHGFSEDLDVFGQSSLFQMINTTKTKSGRNKLGEILNLNKLPSKEEIIKKQEAIKELGDKVKWRQELYIDASFKKKGDKNELEGLINWCKVKEDFPKIKIIFAYIFIALTFIDLFCVITGILRPSVLILHLMINFVLVKLLVKDNSEIIDMFHSTRNSIRAYYRVLSLIEKEKFESSYLKDLQSEIKSKGDYSCCEEMKKLSNLLDWVGDSQANAYYFLINIIAFADVFILFNLEKWKEKNCDKIENWLEVMGEFEALSSISNLHFDNDNWNFPEITENREVIGENIGHPLIGQRAVKNSYSLTNEKKVTLITGSNMSGKSTFLRTIGLNMVLSYIGAPCYADKFKCGVMNIYTCMRTKDNLEESISSFYAEILRIKLIIEACKKGEKVFFLLDEIFKGTNSRDRHIGATVLVKQLIKNGAIGMLSTHDLELCDLEETMKEVENYNFREYYEDNKIKFDYKLRKGKSTTQNAVYLMKLAGIDFNIED